MTDPRESQETYLKKLARRNVCDGILQEPRLYFDQFVFASGTRFVVANPNTFINREQYPVRILYIVSSMAAGSPASPAVSPQVGDVRLIQRYGMRIKAHDSFYMNAEPIPIPLLHNKRVAASDIITQGSSVWDFDWSFPLGQRDAIMAEAQLVLAPTNARNVSLSFTGVGRASRHPYLFNDTVQLTSTTFQAFNPDNFRNQGAEVVDITQMVLHCSSDTQASNPVGDITQCRLLVKQTGNGTNRNWQITDPNAASQRCPGPLWAPSVSRSVVHRLPGEGWLWQPGQGVTVEVHNFDTSRSTQEAVDVGMLGHIVVT